VRFFPEFVARLNVILRSEATKDLDRVELSNTVDPSEKMSIYQAGKQLITK